MISRKKRGQPGYRFLIHRYEFTPSSWHFQVLDSVCVCLMGSQINGRGSRLSHWITMN
ncbi:hypothetical protein CPB83DRAFT_858542, partial [Crepidotus variabilis]